MKVAIDWLKELVDLKVPIEEVVRVLPLKTIGTKEVTPQFIELDMKGYNRADLLSLRGVAHEVAAITDSRLKFTEHTEQEEQVLQEVNLSKLDIEIEDTKLCPLYCLAKIEDLKVEPSNPNWVKKLNDSGIRTVNNLADITNLVMVEYGQPLHAFDAQKVIDQKIMVRSARQGEKLQTLDNKTRQLSNQDLLITDSDKILGLAGVMGGKDSEVSDQTSTILLEAAIFDPTTLRKTASRLGLHSEASKRFQHGLTKKRLLQAFSAAIKMYQSLGGRLTGIVVIDHLTTTYPIISLNFAKLTSLIGVNMSETQVEKYLGKLGFHAEKDLEGWEVTPPYFRLDIQIEEDVIEEIARMYGYEKIPAKPLTGELPQPIDQSFYTKTNQLKLELSRLGFNEVQTYSFYSEQILDLTGKDKSQLIKLENPMSKETQYLKDELWPNLVEVVAKNLKNGLDKVGVFEVGKVYQIDQQGQPVESYKIGVALADGSNNPSGELIKILENLNPDLRSDLKASTNLNFHPKRQSILPEGVVAEVHPRLTDGLGIDQRIGVVEFKLQ